MSIVPFRRLRGRQAAHRLLDTLLPALCPGCGAELRDRRWICGPCRRGLRAAPGGSLCLICRGRHRTRQGREAGYRCTDPGHALRTGFAAYWMEPPLDTVIHALKYGGRDDLGRPLGRLLASRVSHGSDQTLVTPIPLHRTRVRDRGYNQARVLADAAARIWGAPVVEVLVRARATRAQARLPDAERSANVAGAFQVVSSRLIRGRTWIVVDDVTTTGSTLSVAAGALEAAGAARVIPVALALA